MNTPSGNVSTADRGRMLAATEIARRGGTVTEVRDGRIRLLRVLGPGDHPPVHVRVKTRTGGTWQGSTRDADENPAPPAVPTFWCFVDLSTPRPAFYVVPDEWMRRDIFVDHQRYLRRHGGTRAESPDSEHHAIELPRITMWRDRWDLLGL